MIVRTQVPAASRSRQPAKPRPALHRRAMCHFIALALFGGAAHAATPQAAFSPGWLAGKQAGASRPATAGPGTGQAGGGNVFTPGNVMLQQRVQQSIANLDAAAQAVAAQMSAQKAAQAAAQSLASGVPDGLGAGGLKVDNRVGTDPSLWQNANAPTQSVAGGRTTVEIKQTKSKAIMTWESFNVGRKTTVHFDQTGGTQTNGGNQWIALNRVNDPSGKPSEILGQIKAEGTVYLLNRNGVIFGGGAQVDTHSLLASSLDLFSNDVAKSNAFFLKYGIGSTTDPENILGLGTSVNILTDNGDAGRPDAQRGAVEVERGATISASKDGYALLSAPRIDQGGQIVADNGQVILAAVQTLTLAPNSTANGLDVAALFSTRKVDGAIRNTGLIQARQGRIQWLGEDMKQDGVVVSSTSLSHPGSIRFDLGSLQNVSSVLSLGTGSVTTVLPEKNGETTTSSKDADAAFVTSSVDFNMKTVLKPGALVEVPAGNVTFHRDAYVDSGATIDVSGLADVTLPMSALLVTIPRVGLNELANSPLLRDSFLFSAKNVAIDSTRSGTRPDGLDWVGSPVLNVAGYVNNVPRTVDQLMIRAGNIAFEQGGIVRTGAQLRLEGGFLNYLPGYISTPRLQASNGLIYDIASADPNVDYTGFAGVYSQDHARWGVTETYGNPLLANTGRWDPGFIHGGDAGTLSFGRSDNTALVNDLILDGDVSAHAYAGREQVRSRNEPLGGALDIDVIELPKQLPLSGVLAADSVNFVIQSERVPLETYAPQFTADDPWPAKGGDPADPNNPLWWRSLSTAMIDNAGLRKVRISTAGTVLVKDGAELHVADGGEVDLTATNVNVEGSIVAHGGAINLSARATDQNRQESIASAISMGARGRLDASGLWVNDGGRTADQAQGDHWIDGGSVTLTGYTSGRPNAPDITPDIRLVEGSVIDVSGGGYVGTDGFLAMSGVSPRGRGGDVTLQTHVDTPEMNFISRTGQPSDIRGGAIDLGATLVSEGFSGGGTLTLHAPSIQVGGEEAPTPGIAFLYLDPSMFSSLGFSSYNLLAETDVTIAPGAQVAVRPRAMLADQTALLGVASRSGLLGPEGRGDVAGVGTLAPYARYTQRQPGDGMTIQAGIYRDWFGVDLPGVRSSVTVGKDARIDVDAGGTIGLAATGSVVVDGTLVAPGGSIELHNLNRNPMKPDAPNRSLQLGAESVLDASGISLRDPEAGLVTGDGTTNALRRDGVVLDGGSIQLYSDHDVVAERGSRISVSGASDIYDLPASGRRVGIASASDVATPVWSNGGTLDIQTNTGLYFDGTIDAHGGAAQASGGQLAISTRTGSSQSSSTQGLLVFIQDEWRLPQGSDPFADTPLDAGDGGDLRFAVNRLEGSGVDDLYVGRPIEGGDATQLQALSVAFAGDVSLHTGRSIQLQTVGLSALAADARTPSDGSSGPGGTVALEAPYVAVLGARTPAVAPVSSSLDGGTLSVRADAIDLGGRVNLAGFAQASFDSRGDIRFTLPVGDSRINDTGWLYSTGDLAFTASRLYPVTHYAFLIDAAHPSSDTTVSFHQAARRDNTTPLSAGGTLAVTADHIEQDGTLWVPSGSIVLGTDDPDATKSALGLTPALPMVSARDVHLGAGSVTSVSLGGAVVPYGSTVDGKDWHYDNLDGTPLPLVARPPEKSVAIAGGAIAMDAGAIVDLSGGGELQAAEWVPGTGGSRDVLAQTYTDYTVTQKGQEKSQYADGRPVYAILPGYDTPLAAHDAALELGMGAGPQTGQAVYLSGVPGLPDGVYTLLPARYATLPGAFRVVQNTGVKDAIPGAAATAPDGSHLVTGYFTDTFTGARDARASSFTVQSADTWGKYSEYALTSASTFFTDKAAANGDVVPRLAADAGRLTIAATAALTLGATLDAAPAKGGRGSQVDIAGDAIQVLGGGEVARDGYLHVAADELSMLGAGSLLVGGKRSSTEDGDRVDVLANHVLLSNDAAHPLQGGEIILVANGNGGVTLDDGSVLRATASSDAAGAPLLVGRLAGGTAPAVSGDGALLRVSGLDAAPVIRVNITGLDGSAGTPGGELLVGAGAVIDAATSVSMDATGLTMLAPDATLHAPQVDVTASRIALTGTDPQTQDQAGRLLIGPRLLAQLATSDELTLRGRQAIDLIGDATLSVSHALTLSAPTIQSDGGQASLAAASLTIANDTGAAAVPALSGSGMLQVDVADLYLGTGNTVLSGLGRFGAHAARGVHGAGVGTIDLGAADVYVATPGFSASLGADNRMQTAGAMQLTGDGGTLAADGAMGGKLGFQGGSVGLDTAIVTPGGSVNLHAVDGDVRLGTQAVIDAGGLALPFIDTTVPMPGGTVTLQADAGDVVTSSGSRIDVSGPADGKSAGSAGRLTVLAPKGSALLGGSLAGHAAAGYLGGVLSVDTAGSLDLSALTSAAGEGGMDGSFSVHTRNGDLAIASGQTLRAHTVNLTADGGGVSVAGNIDASGTFGGSIKLFGAHGVDLDGGLDASASAAGKNGGDIAIGTGGIGDGTVNGAFGYENVQRADAGHIRIGAGAHIVQDGAGAGTDGKLYLRAPLLSDGDVPVDIAPQVNLSHTREPSLEAYAVWDTRDASSDPAKHFDGLVDAAGWFGADPSTGKPVLVAGTFTDDAGNVVPGPDPANATQVADYLARYRFTPSAANLAHASFYGYRNGDETQGAGTLMGFISAPGFTFENRLQGALPTLTVRPGVELRNGDAAWNDGGIAVLTNWNLGAGTRDASGALHLAYRYGDQAPALSLRAEGDLDIRASITDGFYQQGSAGGTGGKAPEADQAEANTWYDTIVSQANGTEAIDGLFAKPEQFADGDSEAVKQYYGQYVEYAKYITSGIDEFSDPNNPAPVTPATVISFSLGFGLLDPNVQAPPAPSAATVLNDYPSYLASYKPYLVAAGLSTDFKNTFTMPFDFVTLDGPPTTLDVIAPSAAPVDNSPSPQVAAGNPLPILSATLTGGNSSSYRFTAGAELASSDPGATLLGSSGSVHLSGHTDYADPQTDRVLAAPTVVRTGTGDIDIAAAGDIRWTDDRAPAAVYTAGAPAPGTTADDSASLLRPSTVLGLGDTATPELVVTGPVNPDAAGHLSLHAGGDIEGIQDAVDTTGDLTGTAGTRTAQYWWQWMQTNNSETRSSINFGGFDQGLMSVGGDVSVQAGGDIRQLSVSLPTTWIVDTDASGARSLRTFGGGDLDVHAGGDILSGTYFVARGQGNIQADGRIGSDFSVPYKTPGNRDATMPASTIVAMQDSQVTVQGGGAVSLGGVFNPSLLDSNAVSLLASAGHLDRQNYSSDSRIDVVSLTGDLSYGDLASPISLFTPGLAGAVRNFGETAGDILPATVNFAAANGDLNLLSSGELFPSRDGNLSLLARGSVTFDIAVVGDGTSRPAWGMIDAPLSSLISPLNLTPLGMTSGASAPVNGYLMNQMSTVAAMQSSAHATDPWHADDIDPVRVYALEGDIVNGSAASVNASYLMPNKVAHIQAGRDIVDLAYLGQQLRDADISVIKAGRDIIDRPLDDALPGDQAGNPFAVIAQAGPGYLAVEAGRNLGRLASQTDLYLPPRSVKTLLAPAGGGQYTGINSVGNIYNAALPDQGASIVVSYGVAPGVDRAAFIARYVDPSATKPPGLDDGSAALVAFVENYDAGLSVNTGLVKDRHVPDYSVDEAWARFQSLPAEAQAVFAQQTLFRVLAQVGKDYGDASSPFANQYARGYEALNTLFPASFGYTANGLDGGTNGAETTVRTGDLDIRGSTIQTQRGGDVSIVAPGGEALLGSVSAPPVITESTTGNVLAGPNTQGILTLQRGDISLFTDRSTLLAQSRIFTEQGGDVTIWSSNGDINAGKGAKTNSEIPPVRYLCSVDAWCVQDAAGQVSGAGIATLQTVPGAPEGSVYLMAPRGTVDAGDAGIRVSGNLVVAAAHVANADNVQVKGDAVGLPVVQAVNVGALNAASSAASAATRAAEDVARQQQADARDRQPSIISVQVIGGDPSASIDSARGAGYDSASPVQVVRRAGSAGDGLTPAERARLVQ
ncbi:filamentous haemagglutinin family protein [Luteibacter sp. SG786]|uniref:filamentous haemagglutinin family protein n=1 Tax=Luteibacter sp. SG786 TaxID=2587130 RepID=UPI00141F7ECC|nr:filamentous haemagglutinin family protein [Luteibacter sp. SG786]NII54851.1 filamentous hemagglutinin family protein [Luteibacter sp. SG786]